MKKFWALFKARNIEFFRDRSTLAWNLAFPVLMIIGFSFIFSDDNSTLYKVGVLNNNAEQFAALEFSETRYIEFIDYQDSAAALKKLQQHRVELLLDLQSKQYWINEEAPNSYIVEKLLLGSGANFAKQATTGQKIRYVDWVLPGIIAMNIMFSCLFGVGYVVVRYRKNGVLKRLKATPLSALDFVGAQVISRLMIVLIISTVIFVGCDFFLNFYMDGSYLNLILIAIMGALCLISLGLLIASRSQSEELTGGLLNFASWPMLFLSGVWFSLEGAPMWLQQAAKILPLTHVIDGAREVMIEGAGLMEIADHLLVLAIMTGIFLALGAWLFKWNPE